MHDQLIVERLTDCLFRQIVLCRSKSACGDDEITVAESQFYHLRQSARIITYRIMIHKVKPQQIELLG